MKIILHPLFALSLIIYSFSTTIAQNTWEQKTDFPGAARFHATGFTIGDKIYITTGWSGLTNYQDLWEYDTNTDVWVQKSDFPGAARYAAIGFAVQGRGYICCGRTGSTYYRDLWEYNPVTDIWLQKADFGGTARHHPVAFVLDTIAYVGTGQNASLRKDMWAYSPYTDSWTQKNDFGGSPRHAAVAFSTANSTGYIGSGYLGGNNYTNDFWQYNHINDSWTQLAYFGVEGKEHAVGFAYYSDRAVIGTGWSGSDDTDDMWEYNFINGTWISVAPFTGGIREGAVGFAVNGFGYMGTGYDGNSRNDWWKFLPPITDVQVASLIPSFVVFHDPVTDLITLILKSNVKDLRIIVTDLAGREVYSNETVPSDLIVINAQKWARSIYFISVQSGREILTKKICKAN